MPLKENIQGLCKKNHISVPKLEKTLGFGNGSIYKWDSSSPKLENVIKIAEYFQVSLDWLVDLKGNSINEQPTQLPEIDRLVKAAKKLSPEQIELVTALLNGMKDKQ